MPSSTPALTLAHSPDSDDLVMWWPLTGMRGPGGELVAGELGTPRIDTEGLAFELVPEDVEALNAAVAGGAGARGGRSLDITAISAATYPFVQDRWRITACGGSFGEGYGPKIVVNDDSPVRTVNDLCGARLAVPGTRTSAYMTLSILLHELGVPEADRPEPVAMNFADVPGAVLEGRADAGLLIHEAQLTFGDLGLRLVIDLGAWWTRDSEAGREMALPLGLNVARRDLDDRFGAGTLETVARVLMRSVEYATEHAGESREYLLMHAGDRPEWKDDDLVRRYLDMYVSRMSLDMGEKGRAALGRLLARGAALGLCPAVAGGGEPDVI